MYLEFIRFSTRTLLLLHTKPPLSLPWITSLTSSLLHSFLSHHYPCSSWQPLGNINQNPPPSQNFQWLATSLSVKFRFFLPDLRDMPSVSLLNFNTSFSLYSYSTQGLLATFLFLDLAKTFPVSGLLHCCCTWMKTCNSLHEVAYSLFLVSCLNFYFLTGVYLFKVDQLPLFFFICQEPVFSLKLSYFFASILFSSA